MAQNFTACYKTQNLVAMRNLRFS